MSQVPSVKLIVLVVIVLLVTVLGALFFFKSNAEKKMMKKDGVTIPVIKKEKAEVVTELEMAEAVYAKVTSIEGLNTTGTKKFVISANIPDLTNIRSMKSGDFDSTQLPRIDKPFTVNIADSTVFEGGAMADLKVDSYVRVFSKNKLYSVTELNAERIIITK